jgi:hypothetical protein
VDGGTLPQPGEALPWTGETLPQPGEALPRAGETLPQPGETLPWKEEGVPSTGETLPQPGETLPRAGKTRAAAVAAQPGAGASGAGSWSVLGRNSLTVGCVKTARASVV